MMSPSARRALRWVLWSLLAVAALAGIAVFIVLRLVDMPAVQARLEREVSRMAQGQVSWESLQLRLFPLPHGVLRGARIDIPGVLKGSVDEIGADLATGALLQGRVEIDRLRIVRPKLHLTITASKTPHPVPEDAVQAYRQAIEPVAKAVRAIAPSIAIAVEDATLDIVAPGLPGPLALQASLLARADSDGMGLEAEGHGPLLARVKLQARIGFADLKGSAVVDIDGLKLQAFLDHWLAGSPLAVKCPDFNTHLAAQTDGRSTITSTTVVTLPGLRLTRDDRTVDLSPLRVEAAAGARGQDVDVRVGSFQVGALIPGGSGRFRFRGLGKTPVASVDLPTLDLPWTRDLLLLVVDADASWRHYIERLQAGQATGVRVSAQGETLAALADPHAVSGTLQVAGGAYLAPMIEREVTDIAGVVEWQAGALAVRDATGRMAMATLRDGTFDYRLGADGLSLGGVADVDLARTVDLVRPLLDRATQAVLGRVSSLRGRAAGSFGAAMRAGQWHADIALERADAALRIRDVPWPISIREGRVTIAPGRVQVAGAGGAVGRSTISGAGAELITRGPLRLEGGRGNVRLALDDIYPWLRRQAGLAAALRDIPAVTGAADVTIDRVAGRLDAIDALDVDVTVRPRQIMVTRDDLPGPVSIDDGTVRVLTDSLRVDGVRAGLLDGHVRIAGTLADYRGRALHVDATFSNGSIGEDILHWAWHRAALPVRFEPAGPLLMPSARTRWRRDTGLDVQATVKSGTGTTIDTDAMLKPGSLTVRSVRLRDHASDATIGLATRGRLVDVRFAGRLAGRSVESLLKADNGRGRGSLAGDFRATIDRDLQGRTTAEGRLVGGDIDLTWLTGKPLAVDSLVLEGDGRRVRLNPVTVRWGDQTATFRGEVRRSADELVVNGDIDSPGILVDALLEPRGAAVEAPNSSGASDETPPRKFNIWPLPFMGIVNVRSGFVEYQGKRVEPVAARFVLEHDHAHVVATEAAVCGISFPFIVDLTPAGVTASAVLEADGQQLEATARCLSDQRVLLTGSFDLRADLRTQGRPGDLLKNLGGTLEVRARDGEIRKFALLGNILSLKNVTKLFTKGTPNLGGEGFRYSSITARATIADGILGLEQVAMDSDAMGLAADGKVNLLDSKANLTVLVAPFGSLDRLVRRVPVVGYVVGGTLTSLPVGVTGDIRNPTVVPLGPSAVTSHLLGIFERTLKLPGKMLAPPPRATTAAQPAKPQAATP